MSICPHTHKACHCQPDEGVMCPYGETPPMTKDNTYRDALIRRLWEAQSDNLPDDAKRTMAEAAQELERAPEPAAPIPVSIGGYCGALYPIQRYPDEPTCDHPQIALIGGTQCTTCKQIWVSDTGPPQTFGELPVADPREPRRVWQTMYCKGCTPVDGKHAEGCEWQPGSTNWQAEMGRAEPTSPKKLGLVVAKGVFTAEQIAQLDERGLSIIEQEPVGQATVEMFVPPGEFVYRNEPTERQLTTVGGIEAFTHHPSGLDTAVELARCPFCGNQAAYHDSGRLERFNRYVACTNTSCGVRTPEHYQSREAAAAAWNRRDPHPAPQKKSDELGAVRTAWPGWSEGKRYPAREPRAPLFATATSFYCLTVDDGYEVTIRLKDASALFAAFEHEHVNRRGES